MITIDSLKKIMSYLLEIYPRQAGNQEIRKNTGLEYTAMRTGLIFLKNWFLIEEIPSNRGMTYYKISSYVRKRIINKMRSKNGTIL